MMKCAICNREFSDAVYPLHVERCKPQQPEPIPESVPEKNLESELIQAVEEQPVSEPPQQPEPIPEKKKGRK